MLPMLVSAHKVETPGRLPQDLATSFEFRMPPSLSSWDSTAARGPGAGEGAPLLAGATGGGPALSCRPSRARQGRSCRWGPRSRWPWPWGLLFGRGDAGCSGEGAGCARRGPRNEEACLKELSVTYGDQPTDELGLGCGPQRSGRLTSRYRHTCPTVRSSLSTGSPSPPRCRLCRAQV